LIGTRGAAIADSGETDVLHLTTIGRRSGQPREIEIWFTRRQARYYVIAETGLRAHWVRNLLAHPGVRFRVGRRLYSGTARVLDPAAEPALHAAVAALSVAKYGWGDGLIVELAPSLARPRRERRAPG
jgi:deazaflavin-dependent oxidoreductase (nitroreductase family)